MAHFYHNFFFLLLAASTIYLVCWTFFMPFNSCTFPTTAEFFDSSKGPRILAYHKFFRSRFFDSSAIEELEKCEYVCQFSDNKLLYPFADVVIFHAPAFQTDYVLSRKNPNQLYVLFSMEAEPNAKLPASVPKDFFNITMTYRKDSTIWIPYDKFEEIEPHEKDNETLVWSDEQVNEMITMKSKLAVQFVSNCDTHSRRETYLAELQKVADLTIFGTCNGQPFSDGNDETIMIEFEKHYFYLAFENSVCDKYVTEKFWRLKNLIVPVVLKRSVLKGIVDDKYFIAAGDFKSPKELSERLLYLSENPEEYKKYFGWTKKYKKTIVSPFLKNGTRLHGLKKDYFCKLCEIATKKENYTIEDIHEWWKIDSKCEKDFALKIGGKENSWINYVYYKIANLFS